MTLSKIISFHARNDEEDYAVYCSGKDQRVTRREIDKLIKEVLDYDMNKGLFFSLSDFSDGWQKKLQKKLHDQQYLSRNKKSLKKVGNVQIVRVNLKYLSQFNFQLSRATIPKRAVIGKISERI